MASPPKRVTRARAAKTADEPVAEGPVSRKITTASARAAGVKKAVAAPKVTKATTRRKAELQLEPDTEAAKVADEKPEKVTKSTTKARAGAKKSNFADSDMEAKMISKTRTRRTAAPVKDEDGTKKAKSSTRATKTTEPVPTTMPTDKATEELKRSTRGRPATAATRAMASGTTTRSTAPRKKVTFGDALAQDKENIPVAKGGIKKQTTKAATGITAKPVRRAAPLRSALRSRKAEEPEQMSTLKSPAQPLSLKKIDQVVKSWSSSEDELNDAMRVRALSKSPVKAPLSVQKPRPEAQQADISSREPNSPSKDPFESVLKSPVRRPPASPLKDILKESPKKFLFDVKGDEKSDEITKPIFKDALKQSPKKAGFIASLSPTRQLQTAQTPLKMSLLASPARRPMSPEKAALFVSPEKSTLSLPAIDKRLASTEMQASPFLQDSPPMAMKSPSKAPADLIEAADMAPELPVAVQPPEHMDHTATPILGLGCTLAPEAEATLTSPALPAQVDSPAVVSKSLQFRSTPALENSESEDELSASKTSRKTPVRRTRKSIRYATAGSTPASTKLEAQASRNLSVTPLAIQLSSWLASSPEKQEEPAQETERRGSFLFTFGKRVSNRVSNASQESAAAPTVTSSPRFFAEQMAVQEQETVQVHEDGTEPGTDDTEMVDAGMPDIEYPDLNSASQQSAEVFNDENAVPSDLLNDAESTIVLREGDAQIALAETAPLSDLVYADESLLVLPETEESTAPLEQTQILMITPVRRSPSKRREVHTVSKVPLRPEGSPSSPIKIMKKRSKSLANHQGLLAGVQRLPLAEAAFYLTEDAELVEDDVEDVDSQQVTPRPVPSEKPPATIPVQARQVFPQHEDETPVKIARMRRQSTATANMSAALQHGAHTVLAPSTSFETYVDETSDDEMADIETPKVKFSEVPPATMPNQGRKVSLRPENETPIKVLKKRSRSMANPSDLSQDSHTLLAPSTSFETQEDNESDYEMLEVRTPAAVLSETPPASMPAQTRRVLLHTEGKTPLKVSKKRSKSMAHPEDLNHDPRTILAPSTSFETYEDTASGAEMVKAATPVARLSDVPPATMPAQTRKTPLRTAGGDSPIKIPKMRRGKSTGAALGDITTSELLRGPVNTIVSSPNGSPVTSPAASTPRINEASNAPSPDTAAIHSLLTPVRSGGNAQVLKGAVVHVDVHTTEGEEAGGVFVDLLGQMGARTMKQWSWNPRASMSAATTATVSGSPNDSPAGRGGSRGVGITHVVFKDGSKRVLQKVREAKGQVLCVGVGWVLE